MLPATKKYIQIPSHDYIKVRRLLMDLSKEYAYKATTFDKYCPPDVKKKINEPSRYEQRYIDINKLISELELHSRVVEDY